MGKQTEGKPMQATLLIVLAGACNALVGPQMPVQSMIRQPSSVNGSPLVMLAEGSQTRRTMLAIGIAVVAPAANAMTVPGLNSKGLVPQTKTKTGVSEFTSVRDASSFWSSKGIMDSVPKVKGIITPKTPVK